MNKESTMLSFNALWNTYKPHTMRSYVHPHGVRLHAGVHSRIAAGHGLRQQSLYPLIPSRPTHLSSQFLIPSVNSFPSYNFTLSCSWADSLAFSVPKSTFWVLMKIQGDGNLAEELMKVWEFSDFFNQVKSDITSFKWLFKLEDDEGIGGKCTCVQLIAINKELSNS